MEGWGWAGTGGVRGGRGGGELALEEELWAIPEEWQELDSVVVISYALKSDILGSSFRGSNWVTLDRLPPYPKPQFP